jgi:arginyl-tRNA synthetase
MPTVSQILRERLQNALQAIGTTVDEPLQVAPTADPRHGDYQTNAAMVLARKLKVNPRNLATQIGANLATSDIGSQPEVAGPGFINFRLAPEFLARRLHELALDRHLGVEPIATAKVIVVDFSSPNIAKPMHVGHIRSTNLGDALARVARCLGHTVMTDNHLGAWGTHFGRAAKNDRQVLQACRRELVKLQQCDVENRGIW